MVEKDIVEYIQGRQKRFEKIRTPYERVWEEVGRYIMPRLEFMVLDYMKGKKIGTYAYDGTAINAVDLLINGFQGHLVSKSIEWVLLEYENPELNDVYDARVALEETNHRLYVTLESSNFYSSIHEYIGNGASVGTTTIYSEEDLYRGGPVYLTHHPKEIYISEDIYGRVDTTHRKFKMTAKNALEVFEDNKDALCDAIKNAGKSGKSEELDEEYEFIHAVYPNRNREWDKIDSANMPWVSYYIESKGESVLRKRGYKENPFSTWRWDKISDEIYGRSPAHNALVETLKLNQMEKTMLRGRHKAVDPPFMVPAKHMYDHNIGPGGKTYYESLEAERILQVQTATNFAWGIEGEERAREAIKNHMMVDFFLLLAQADRQMTATEILEKQGEKAAVLGAVIGKLEEECLDPVINRTLRIEAEAGRLPEDLLNYAGESIAINYVGPLANIQRRAYKSRGILHSIEASAPLLQMFPEAQFKINGLQAIEQVWESHGMPKKLIRGDDEAIELFQQYQKAIAREQESRELAAEADAAQKLNEPVKPGSILQQIMTGVG